jgi:hypothetical protein
MTRVPHNIAHWHFGSIWHFGSLTFCTYISYEESRFLAAIHHQKLSLCCKGLFLTASDRDSCCVLDQQQNYSTLAQRFF